MASYKVIESFELEGVVREVGSEVELTDEQATELAGKVEAVVAPSGETPAAPAAEGQSATPAETPAAPSGETPAPAETPTAPSSETPKEGGEGWVGGHTVGRE